MDEDYYKDLSRYFRLAIYRDEGSLLPEEYEELNEILKRNKASKEIDDAYFNYLMGRITEEDYNKIHDYYFEDYELNIIKKLNL